jgi:hypothetical protein
MTDHHRTFHGRLVPGGFALDKNGREVVLTVALPIADAGPVLDLITSSPRDPRVAVAIGEVAVALAACLRNAPVEAACP